MFFEFPCWSLRKVRIFFLVYRNFSAGSNMSQLVANVLGSSYKILKTRLMEKIDPFGYVQQQTYLTWLQRTAATEVSLMPRHAVFTKFADT